MPVDATAADRFRLLFDEHWAEIAAYARRRLPDADAADLAAEVFLVVWRRIEAIPEGAAARLWLFGGPADGSVWRWQSPPWPPWRSAP